MSSIIIPDTEDRPPAEGGEPNRGKFITIPDVIPVLLSSPENCPTEIPDGIKENVSFILNNVRNAEREAAGQRLIHRDDCGVWISLRSKIFYSVLENGRFKMKTKHGGQLVDRQGRVLNPQPPSETILRLKCYETQLRRSSKEDPYLKRITWISKYPAVYAGVPRVALVEYVGPYPRTRDVHRNTKTGNARPYVRSSPQVLDKIRSAVTTSAARAAYRNLTTSGAQPRDRAQCANFRKRYQRKMRDAVGAPKEKLSDEDLVNAVRNINGQDNNLVQEVVYSKGSSPIIILYSDEQRQDFLKLRTDLPVTIGIDRSFNLGSCSLTILVFQHYQLICKSTQKAPLFLGPILLHWNGTYDTYHTFFSHILRNFGNVILGEVVGKHPDFSQNEEAALTTAMRDVFSSSSQSICRKHLYESASNYLVDVVGCENEYRSVILHRIFDSEEGLLGTLTESAFDSLAEGMALSFDDTNPKFVPYFRALTDMMKNYIFAPYTELDLSQSWQDSDSTKFLMKQIVHWYSLPLSQLIIKLEGIIDRQYGSVENALHGEGDYVVAPEYSHHTVDHDEWVRLTRDEQNEIFSRFLDSPITSRYDR